MLEQNRNLEVPPLAVFETAERQIQASFLKENEIRAFLESRDLVTVPGWLMHYRNREMPAHLEPLAFMGVTDDLTGTVDSLCSAFLAPGESCTFSVTLQVPAAAGTDTYLNRTSSFSATIDGTTVALDRRDRDPAVLDLRREQRTDLVGQRSKVARRPGRRDLHHWR